MSRARFPEEEGGSNEDGRSLTGAEESMLSLRLRLISSVGGLGCSGGAGQGAVRDSSGWRRFGGMMKGLRCEEAEGGVVWDFRAGWFAEGAAVVCVN